jgi:hypothetical protein
MHKLLCRSELYYEPHNMAYFNFLVLTFNLARPAQQKWQDICSICTCVFQMSKTKSNIHGGCQNDNLVKGV